MAMLLGMAVVHGDWERGQDQVLVAWAIYAGCFYLMQQKKLSDARMARSIITGFGPGVFCLLGGRLCLHVLQS